VDALEEEKEREKKEGEHQKFLLDDGKLREFLQINLIH